MRKVRVTRTIEYIGPEGAIDRNMEHCATSIEPKTFGMIVIRELSRTYEEVKDEVKRG